MFSASAILDADDAALMTGLAYAKEIKRLIELAWGLMKPDPELEEVEPGVLERFATSFESFARSPLGNGMLELWIEEFPQFIRAGDWERINGGEVNMAYNDALIGIGMIQLEIARRQGRATGNQMQSTIRF